MVSGALVGTGPSAGAETLGYPHSGAKPTRAEYEWWIDENGNGRYDGAAEAQSSRGYYYRNCTDYVAWKLSTLGVPASRWRGLGHAGVWAINARGRAGVTIRPTPVKFSVAVQRASTTNRYGHVAFVEDVLADGRIKVSEYNKVGTGIGGTRTGTPASLGFTEFIDFGLRPTPPPPPAPSRWSQWGSLGGNVRSVAAARNADGRLEIFTVGTDAKVYSKWQTRPGSGPWSGWLGTQAHVSPFIAAETNADGRVEMFSVGTDGKVYNRWQWRRGGNWSDWGSLGGDVRSVAAARNADGRLEIFAVGTDNAVYNKWQRRPGGDWSGWARIGGHVSPFIATETNADGRIELFAVGTNGVVYNKWQRRAGGSWSDWESLGGNVRSVAAARNADGRLEIFVVGTNDAVYNKWQRRPGGDWSDWDGMGGRVRPFIAAETNGRGRIEMFVIGTDGAVYSKWQP